MNQQALREAVAARLREHRQLMWSAPVKPGVPKCQLVPLDLLNEVLALLSNPLGGGELGASQSQMSSERDHSLSRGEAEPSAAEGSRWNGGCGSTDCVNGCDAAPDLCAWSRKNPS